MVHWLSLPKHAYLASYKRTDSIRAENRHLLFSLSRAHLIIPICIAGLIQARGSSKSDSSHGILTVINIRIALWECSVDRAGTMRLPGHLSLYLESGRKGYCFDFSSLTNLHFLRAFYQHFIQYVTSLIMTLSYPRNSYFVKTELKWWLDSSNRNRRVHADFFLTG